MWFRSAVERIFNIARLPRPTCDVFSERASPEQPDARTVICSVHDWLYALEVMDKKGDALQPKVIESRILGIVEDVGERVKNGEKATPISVLTADHRDKWAGVRRHAQVSIRSFTLAIYRTRPICSRSLPVTRRH